MYDPQTVAHEIKYPWKNKHGYRSSIITIWHVDPEKNVLGCRRDDSCGWFSPPYTQEQRDAIVKIAKRQYEQLFAKQVAYAEEKSYAYVCYNQDCYGVIYWTWRALKAHGKKGWQYGKLLSARELDEIYKLATNPVDNFQSSIFGVKKYEDFEPIFIRLWQCFLRFNRPWYKHPRWHIKHWRIQFRLWQSFKRRWLEKCCKCGKRGFTGSAYSDWDGTKIWCEKCNQDSIKAEPQAQNTQP